MSLTQKEILNFKHLVKNQIDLVWELDIKTKSSRSRKSFIRNSDEIKRLSKTYFPEISIKSVNFYYWMRIRRSLIYIMLAIVVFDISALIGYKRLWFGGGWDGFDTIQVSIFNVLNFVLYLIIILVIAFLFLIAKKKRRIDSGVENNDKMSYVTSSRAKYYNFLVQLSNAIDDKLKCK